MVELSPEKQDLIKRYEKEGIDRVKFAVTTIDGILVGKYMSLEKFKKVIGSTGAMCDVVFGWDIGDVVYDYDHLFTGWHTGFPDGLYEVDISSERRLVEEENIPLFLVNFVKNNDKGDLELHDVCPRAILKRVIQKGKDMGFDVKLGYEYEFFVFNETPHTANDKGFKNLKPITPGSFVYAILMLSTLSQLFNDLTDYMQSLEMTLESIHCETGPGAWEAAIKYSDALRAADDAEIFKTFTKVFFEQRDLMTTFMAKFSMEEMGLGGHVHHSLYDAKTHKPLFYDPDSKSKGSMSETMKYFVAGQLKYSREFLVMSVPNINSYARLTRGAWAPTSTSWSIDNRTAAIRAISGSKNSQRIEYRIPGADANPYLVGAAIIASGLQGITEKLELPEENLGNIYEAQKQFPEEKMFSSCLKDATRLFSKSKVAKEWFGENFVTHYTASREWEVREYERNINDWQLKRYFEII